MGKERKMTTMIDRKFEKSKAKDILRRAQVSPYLFTAIFVAISMVLNGISLVMGSPEVEKLYGYGEFTFAIPRLITLPTVVVTFLGLLMSLLLTTLSYGYYSYSMTTRAGNYAGYDTLLDGFTYVGKVVVLELLIALYVMGWAMLIFVPAIIAAFMPRLAMLAVPLVFAALIPAFMAAYRYRFAHLNLCENPDIRPAEAIRMSKAQTRGLKWKLFVLDLSFLGWNMLVSLSGGLLNIYVMPYRVQTELGYYEFGKAASGVKPTPDEPYHDGQFHSFDI